MGRVPLTQFQEEAAGARSRHSQLGRHSDSSSGAGSVQEHRPEAAPTQVSERQWCTVYMWYAMTHG